MILLAPWLLYLLVANALIATPLLEHLINRKPNRFLISWGLAFTWWPGRIYVQDFKLAFTAPRVAFDLTIDRSSANVSLAALLHRTFRATHVRSAGASYRMYTKVPPDAPISPRVAAWPHLEGTSPIVGEQGGPPMSESAKKKLWTVNLDDVDTTYREVWISEYHWKGNGRARGAFALKPMTHLWVGPIETELQPGELTVGDTLVSSDFGGAFHFFLTPVNIDMQHKLRMLRGIQLEGSLGATLETLSFAKLYGLDASGRGHLDVDARIENGTVESGTEVALALEGVKSHLIKNGGGFDGVLAVTAKVEGDEPWLHATGGGTVHVPLPRDEVVNAFIPDVKADARLTTNDFVGRWRIAAFDTHVPELMVEDVQPILDGFRHRLPSLVIPLVKNKPLEAEGLRAHGSPRDVRLELGEARIAETKVSGTARLERGQPPDADLDVHVAALPIGIKLRSGRASWRFFPKRP